MAFIRSFLVSSIGGNTFFGCTFLVGEIWCGCCMPPWFPANELPPSRSGGGGGGGGGGAIACGGDCRYY